MSRHWAPFIFGLLLLPLLTGCLLISGERTETVPLEAGGVGQYKAEFVSADGETRRQLATGQPVVKMVLEVVVQAEQGELTLEILKPNLATALTVSGRYGLGGEDSIVVETDGAGEINYRVIAYEVRNGTYTIRFYPEPPAATPSPQPTP